MNKRPDITEWARDCKSLGTQIRRYGYVNSCMPENFIKDEWDKTVKAIQDFANKYCMDYAAAEKIGAVVADSVSLGVAF
jgi:hypothetical protein